MRNARSRWGGGKSEAYETMATALSELADSAERLADRRDAGAALFAVQPGQRRVFSS